MPRDHIRDYTVVAGDNADIDGIDIAEQCAPGNINNAIREAMADTAEWFDDFTGKLVSAGAANAYTLTTNDSLAAYAAGTRYTFEANHANTGAATLNVNAIGAKAIVKNNDVALAGGEIEAGQMVDVIYESTADNFQMVSQPAKIILETLNVDNIQIDGNTISATNTNGNIILSPDGTGDVRPSATDTFNIGASGVVWAGGFFGDITLQDPTPTITITDTDDNSDCTVSNEAGDLILSADQNAEALNSDIKLRVDGANQAFVTDGTLEPAADNDLDLGTASKLYKVGYFHDLQVTDVTPRLTLTESTNNTDCVLECDTDGSLFVRADLNNEQAGSEIRLSVDGTTQVNVTDGTIEAQLDNDIDLGTALLEFKDLYIDGTANIDALTLTSGATVTIIHDEDDMASNDATGLATQQSVKAYADTLPNNWIGAQATTSGTSKDFTGIPSWATKITMWFDRVSKTSNADILVQPGVAGGPVTTGYESTCNRQVTADTITSSTAGFHIDANTSGSDSVSGKIELANVGGNVWAASGNIKYGTAAVAQIAGSVDLGGALTQVRLTTSTGTDAFDAGQANVEYA